MKGLDDFYRILERIEYGGQRAVLATIVKVEGSSYREHGTSMLLVCDETSTGMLSGGCLESDLKVRAKHWFDMNLDDFERLESILLTYDMRSNDVLSWGRVPGCNGLITVLLEPITSLFRQQLIQIKHQMDRGFGVVSLRKVHNGHCNERAFIFEDGRILKISMT